MATIERASPSDLGELSRIFLDIFPDRLSSLQQASDVMRMYLHAAERFFVAKEKGKIIGFALSVRSLWDFLKYLFGNAKFSLLLPDRFKFVRPVFLRAYFYGRYACFAGVLLKYRGKGLGDELMRTLFASLPACKIYFEFNATDKKIRNFCKGFEGKPVASNGIVELWYKQLI